MEHVHGPHIFNTSDAEVWAYVSRHAEMMPYINRVKAATARGLFSFPINLLTLNQFYGRQMNPDEAKQFMESVGDKSIIDPMNFEEKALQLVGRELYETFFKGYTIKQWGGAPKELPASILDRLPIRYDNNDSYYNTTWQAIPRNGYTRMIESILNHPLIDVSLETPWSDRMRSDYLEVVYTGAIDAFYQFKHGRLGYRTVSWEKHAVEGDFQGHAVINYPDKQVPYTRVHEHKHFAPWEDHEKSIVFTEYSRETGPDDMPYYPKRLTNDKRILSRYIEEAKRDEGIYFLGRLGTYRYMDMDDVIAEALDFSRRYLQWQTNGGIPRPKFGNDH